jgi:hypothetical protein
MKIYAFFPIELFSLKKLALTAGMGGSKWRERTPEPKIVLISEMCGLTIT